MRKVLKIVFCLLLMMAVLSSCAKTRILNSEEAAEKLRELGYLVNVDIQHGDAVKAYGITQVTVLSADLEDEFIQVYYFTCEEDTETFYKAKVKSLSSGVEVVKKNKYSIVRGTVKASQDFLKLGNS